jgi:hypothetical protein
MAATDAPTQEDLNFDELVAVLLQLLFQPNLQLIE